MYDASGAYNDGDGHNAAAGGGGDDDDAVETDEDDADSEDASQAPAFLAGCGHWTNIHFEMGLPTTPMHSILCTVIHCTVL